MLGRQFTSLRRLNICHSRIVLPLVANVQDERRESAKNVLTSQHRHFRVSVRSESTLVMGGAAILVAAVGTQHVLKLYSAYEQRNGGEVAPSTEESGESGEGDNTVKSESVASDNVNDEQLGEESTHRTKSRREREKERAKAREARAKEREREREEAKKRAKETPGGGGFFNDFMTDFMHQMGYSKTAWAETKAGWFAQNFYDGGFEEKMTKREAALILGVRENSSLDRIKKQHRKILLINHPDRGGSPYVSAKINEAKDLLIKGRK